MDIRKDGDSMKVGFIGAGKMGFTLGMHFKRHNEFMVTGYYSNNEESAKAAAQFTDTKYYEDLESLVKDSDAIFLTVPDGQIAVVADKLDRLDDAIEDKIICHTSGAVASDVFSGMHSHIYGYSIHPMYAVNSKTESYKNFSDSFITIEGNEKYLDYFKSAFLNMGHRVKILAPEHKAAYHCSAVFSSNLVIALFSMAKKLLLECGFSDEEAEAALMPLFLNNADNMKKGASKALTGPVARCDCDTVRKHMNAISGEKKEVYRFLSKELSYIAEEADEAGVFDYDLLRSALSD